MLLLQNRKRSILIPKAHRNIQVRKDRRMKKIALTAAIVCCLLFSFTSNAAAAFYYSMQIVRIDYISSGPRILAETASGWKTFLYLQDDSDTNRILSICLTAMSLGTNVHLEYENITGVQTLTGVMLLDQ